MIPEFEPRLKYPDLTQERLSILANAIRRVRSECVALYEPENGDGDWSLGCRVYQRTFFAIKQLATTVDWLTINQELKPLQFSFGVGSVPLRFYKGDPEDPPSRYLSLSQGEFDHIQMSFEFEGLPSPDTILRLAVAVDSTRQVSSVSVVEIDEFKEVVGVYTIPFEVQIVNITPMKAPPVSVPPVVAIPLKKETAEEKKNKETPINAAAK
jgi:hypothetical protein